MNSRTFLIKMRMKVEKNRTLSVECVSLVLRLLFFLRFFLSFPFFLSYSLLSSVLLFYVLIHTDSESDSGPKARIIAGISITALTSHSTHTSTVHTYYHSTHTITQDTYYHTAHTLSHSTHTITQHTHYHTAHTITQYTLSHSTHYHTVRHCIAHLVHSNK